MLFSKKKKRKAGTKAKKAVRKKRVRKRVRTKVRTRVRKRVRKRTGRVKAQRKTIKKAPRVSKGEEVQVGTVTHYFPHVKAGAILVEKGTIAAGDVIHIKGHTSDFKQKIKSLQINRVPVEKGSEGDEVGVLIKSRVRINDKVFKVKS